ncbi:hypothetical protein K2224_16895 [Streptomyces sp. BHT-5-2]|nr:hypothetical protein K2224_16895 [Streptomyces sp. BHT-5-2]
MAEEILYAREFTSGDDRVAAVSVWNVHYNYHRPHSGAAGAADLRRRITAPDGWHQPPTLLHLDIRNFCEEDEFRERLLRLTSRGWLPSS